MQKSTFPKSGAVIGGATRGRDMVSTDNMQKARVQKFDLVTYGGHAISAVSGISVPPDVIFLLQVIQLGNNPRKLLGFGAVHFHLPRKKIT